MADQGKAAYDLASKQQSKVDLISKRKSTLATKVRKSEYGIYQAVLKNTISVSRTNDIAGLQIWFDQGECGNTNRIEVYDSANVLVPFQWEDDKHPRTGASLGAYSDNSLKCGTIWIKVPSIGANASLTYTIKIYEADRSNSYTAAVTTAVVDNTVGAVIENLLANGVEVRFNQVAGYLLSTVLVNGQTMTNTLLAQRVAIRNNAYAELDNATPANIQNASRTVTGSGVLFMDFTATYQYTYNTNITVKSVCRLWANGQFDVNPVVLVTGNLASNVLNGVSFKMSIKQSFTVVGGTDEGYTSGKVGTSSIALQGKYLQYEADGNTVQTQSYILTPLTVQNFVSSTDVYLYMLWTNTSPNTFAISSGAQYSAMFHYVTSQQGFDNQVAQSVTDFKNRVMNKLVAASTKYSKNYLIDRISALAAAYLEFNYDRAMSTTAFKGAWAIIQLASDKLQNIDSIKSIVDGFYADSLNVNYGGGTQAGFYSAYTGGRGIEYIGRDMGSLRYLIKECEAMGYGDYLNRLYTVAHNLADFFVQVETFSGGTGAIILSPAGGGNTDNLNAEATAMRHLKQSLDIREDATRRTVFNRVKAKFEASLLYQNILPQAPGNKTIKDPHSTYHGFSIFDYIQAVDTPSFDTTSYILDYSSPSGSIKEYGYDTWHSRRGFPHTALYAAYALRQAETLSSLQQAANIIEHMVSKCYPSGWSEYPFDGWTYVGAGGLSAEINTPIALAIACHIILKELY